MSKIDQQLKKLEEISKEACRLTYGEHGVGWHYLTPNIQAYTAEDRRHQAANIFDVKVSLHDPAAYTFTDRKIGQLNQILANAQTELEGFKKELSGRDTAEAEKKKQERIAALEDQLRDLKS